MMFHLSTKHEWTIGVLRRFNAITADLSSKIPVDWEIGACNIRDELTVDEFEMWMRSVAPIVA